MAHMAYMACIFLYHVTPDASSDAMGSVDESLEAAYTGRGAPQGLGRG